MSVEIVTKDDLQLFRNELLNDIKTMMTELPGKTKKWLKTPEVMELLGLSEVTLQTLRNRGKIPFRKLGGTCFYNVEEIDKVLSDL